MKGGEDLPDERVIRHVLDGEIGYFEVLVRRYQQRIFSLGRRFFRNEDDAYDFVQEVFIRAYQKLDTFRGESRFYSWILRVAYNHGVNSLRRTRPYTSLIEETAADDSASPERTGLRNAAKDALKQALEEIPEKYAVCLDLYFFDGLSYEEVAEVSGFPLNTVKSHIFRGKKLLREELRGTAAEDYHEV